MVVKKLFFYLMIGGLAAIFYKVANDRSISGQDFFSCIWMGMLGAFIPGAFKEASKTHMPFFQSWFMILFLLFFIQFCNSASAVPHSVVAFMYGYLIYLLWEGYHHNLRKV